jgi:hypothetical protein
MPLRGLVRRSLIASLIRLRPEPFGAHHARQAAESRTLSTTPNPGAQTGKACWRRHRLPASGVEGPRGISDGNRDGKDGSREQPEAAINSQLLSHV